MTDLSRRECLKILARGTIYVAPAVATLATPHTLGGRVGGMADKGAQGDDGVWDGDDASDAGTPATRRALVQAPAGTSPEQCPSG